MVREPLKRKMAKNTKSILGIDIGTKKTKVVQLAFSGKSTPDLVTCELLDTGFADESFQVNMKTFLGDSKLRNAFAAVSFEDPSLIIRKFELPKMPELDLIEAIKWNLRDSVENEIENYTIQYSKIAEFEDGDVVKNELVVYAANRTAVADFKLRVEGLGLVLFMIEPAAVTLASALDRCRPDEENFHAGLDIGYNHTKFYVIGKRNFIFSRPIIGISYEQFEKQQEDFRQRLAIEVQKSIDTFQVNFKMQAIKSINVSGGGALIEDLSTYLQTNMGLETTNLNPFSTVDVGDKLGAMKPELFAQAVSLAYLQP